MRIKEVRVRKATLQQMHRTFTFLGALRESIQQTYPANSPVYKAALHAWRAAAHLQRTVHAIAAGVSPYPHRKQTINPVRRRPRQIADKAKAT